MRSARFSPLISALLVTGVTLAWSAACAEELPKDINAIESLTVEQARTLVAENLGGFSVPYEIEGVGTFRHAVCMTLNGLKAIDAETAQVIVGHGGGPLFLDGLTALSDEAAAALAKNNRGLSLNGLTTLSDAAAKALTQQPRGFLYLNGLTTLSDALARTLAQHQAWLSLNGLTTLSDTAADALAQHKGDSLSLNGLTTLSDAAAKALMHHRGDHLYLNGVTTLSDAAAKALAQRKGRHLVLNGLTTLSAEAAKALAQRRGRLSLNGLEALSGEAAQALAEHKGGVLSLNGLTTLSAETATALVPHHRGLTLNGLTTLSPEAAKALAQRKGRLTLNGLTTLSPEAAQDLAAIENWDGRLPAMRAFESPESRVIAQALATRKGLLLLPALKRISPKTLSALLEKDDVEIPLVETLELIPEPDGSPTEDLIIPEWLEERQKRQRAAEAARKAE